MGWDARYQGECLPTGRVHSPARRDALRLTLFLTFFGAALPCQAHVPILPRNLAEEAAGDLAASVAVVLIAGLIAFFAADKGTMALARSRNLRIGYWTIKAGAAGVGILTTFAFWYFGVSVPAAAAATAAASAAHVDKPAHGGQVEAIGNNHLEVALRPGRGVALYIEGITTAIPSPIPQEVVWGKVRRDGHDSDSPVSIPLHAEPLTQEGKGLSSVFTGQIPASFAGQPVQVAVTVPLAGKDTVIRVNVGAGAGATVGPTLATPVHDTSATRVAALPMTAEQKALYFTPGGAYTEADIAANGAQTPDEKFAGLMANHHANPKKGARICPVTLTQANPKFPWIVSGKTYLFCCPPCIAEFVKEAKSRKPGGAMPAPDTFVQK